MSPHGDIAPRVPRILIVDDDPDNRELLGIIMGWEGYLAVTAACGEEALAAVALQLPDLIVLDVMMPGMSGYEVLASLRSNPATTGIPVLMVTALDDRTARELAMRAGAQEFMSKPIDRVELCERARKLLAG